MQIKFESPFLSIIDFPTTNLPKFTIITGVNGSGKTHLLKAISAGRVLVDIAPNIAEDIRFYDWTTLVPNNAGEFHSAAVYNNRDNIIEWSRQACLEQREKLDQWLSSNNLIGKIQRNASSVFRLNETDLNKRIGEPKAANRAWKQLESIAAQTLQIMKRNGRNQTDALEIIDRLHNRLGHKVLCLTTKDFEKEPYSWGSVNFFQQSFAELFVHYFELKKHNLLRRMVELEGREPAVPSIPDDQFIATYGEPPWDFINHILKKSNLDFEIDYPEDYSMTKFTPQLRKISTQTDLKFDELSSGERILMSFAFCLYYSKDNRQILRRPKLLLFDEIDAPLHPSMSRQLVDTIQNTLVGDQGVQVILATHSPSTVAVAPEEAVYAMRPGELGLHKVGKRQAISALTMEIPTLSVNFSGRRQVLVEGHHDARRYEKLYRRVSGNLTSERSLAFISVGKRKDRGEEGGGCDQVRQFVNELAASGNDSVFGLVDWDLKNQSTERIIVLAEGNRYAIENCLLDPLLIGALAVLTNPEWVYQTGLLSDKRYIDFKNLTEEECQAIIDNVERKVLRQSESVALGERQEVAYTGGMSAKISNLYLRMNGHTLEGKIKESLPILKVYHNEGDLLNKIIESVLRDFHELIPIDITNAFRRILEFEH